MVLMQNIKLLQILIGITLVVSLLNTYGVFNLQGKVDVLAAIAGGGSAPSAAPTPTPSAPAGPAPKVDVSADDDPVKGDDNAPITIIEFSDFECPFCGRFYTQTLPQLEENYIKTGKAKLVFRDFPLSFHQNAQKASEAAECAKDQDKFWEYHDHLFVNQQSLSDSALKGYAKTLGLDTAKFDKCLDSGEKASEVQADFAAGSAAGVSGTPSFFINGVKLVGAQPFAAFQQIIDAELAE